MTSCSIIHSGNQSQSVQSVSQLSCSSRFPLSLFLLFKSIKSINCLVELRACLSSGSSLSSLLNEFDSIYRFIRHQLNVNSFVTGSACMSVCQSASNSNSETVKWFHNLLSHSVVNKKRVFEEKMQANPEQSSCLGRVWILTLTKE